MDVSKDRVWFVGDLDDHWVAAIADAIPAWLGANRVMGPGELPERLWDLRQAPEVLILHRSRLTAPDADRLARWRAETSPKPFPTTILCIGPYVRYAELKRWSSLVDLVIPEATAIETLPRHLSQRLQDSSERAPSPPPRCLTVDVVSSDHELRGVLSAACAAAGYRTTASRDLFAEGPHRGGCVAASASNPDLTVWDVPVLESDWPELLKRRSRLGPVIALLGFADRTTVAMARENAAAACLELPCDLDDLLYVLDRVACSVPTDRTVSKPGRAESPHAVPPPPVSRTARVQLRFRDRDLRPQWSEDDGTSRIKTEPTP
jgi:hypothetical protein